MQTRPMLYNNIIMHKNEHLNAGVALALKFTGSRKIFADPFKSAKNNF